MCVFTEEEACNCILIPGEEGGGHCSHKHWSLLTLNCWDAAVLSSHTSHDSNLEPPSVWHAAKQNAWHDWHGTISQTEMESAASAFSSVSHTQRGPYHSHRQLLMWLHFLYQWTSGCLHPWLEPDSASGRHCRPISVSPVHVSNMAGIDFLLAGSSAARRI